MSLLAAALFDTISFLTSRNVNFLIKQEWAETKSHFSDFGGRHVGLCDKMQQFLCRLSNPLTMWGFCLFVCFVSFCFTSVTEENVNLDGYRLHN